MQHFHIHLGTWLVLGRTSPVRYLPPGWNHHPRQPLEGSIEDTKDPIIKHKLSRLKFMIQKYLNIFLGNYNNLIYAFNNVNTEYYTS